MTKEQQRIIETAIDEAVEALPDGDDEQLAKWVMEYRYPSFSDDLQTALAVMRVLELIVIREAFARLGD